MANCRSTMPSGAPSPQALICCWRVRPRFRGALYDKTFAPSNNLHALLQRKRSLRRAYLREHEVSHSSGKHPARVQLGFEHDDASGRLCSLRARSLRSYRRPPLWARRQADRQRRAREVPQRGRCPAQHQRGSECGLAGLKPKGNKPLLSNSGRLVGRALRLAQDHRHRGVTRGQSPLILCKRHPEISPPMPLRRQPPVRGRCWSMMEIAGSAPTGRATGRSSRATASNTGRIRK